MFKNLFKKSAPTVEPTRVQELEALDAKLAEWERELLDDRDARDRQSTGYFEPYDDATPINVQVTQAGFTSTFQYDSVQDFADAVAAFGEGYTYGGPVTLEITELP
jgi:hypothetical protein